MDTKTNATNKVELKTSLVHCPLFIQTRSTPPTKVVQGMKPKDSCNTLSSDKNSTHNEIISTIEHESGSEAYKIVFDLKNCYSSSINTKRSENVLNNNRVNLERSPRRFISSSCSDESMYNKQENFSSLKNL